MESSAYFNDDGRSGHDQVWIALTPNRRLKLAARVDYGMNLSSARGSLRAIR
jgi:hypothetical protein